MSELQAAVSEAADRMPLVTLAIFSYNQEAYIREAVTSALRQTYSPLEIIISDDCSSDGTFGIVEAILSEYKGPHSVRLRRNRVNLGIAPHIDQVCREASGELIVLGAGDDDSTSNRVSVLTHAWLASQPAKPSVVYSNAVKIDSTGKELGNLLAKDQQAYCKLQYPYMEPIEVIGCSAAYSRDVFSLFPKVAEDLIAEDSVLFRRAHLLNGALYLPDCLVRYRVGSGVSGISSGTYKEFIERSILLSRERLAQRKQYIADLNYYSPPGYKKVIDELESQCQANAQQIDIMQGSAGLIALIRNFSSGNTRSYEKKVTAKVFLARKILNLKKT